MGTKPKKREGAGVSLREHATLNRQIPGINAHDAAANSKEIVGELAPQTRLETSVASDIAAADVELRMMRERKNMLLWQSAAQPMFMLIRETGVYDDAAAGDLAKKWITGSQEAEKTILALGIDPEFAHNIAYTENVLLIEMIDKSIDRLQRSRRKLLDDYGRLKQIGGENNRRVRRDAIDAELVSEASHET